MFRWFIIALAALAIAACGGGSESGGGSDPLTLEEYADACADYYDPELYTEGDITWGEYRSKLTPPWKSSRVSTHPPRCGNTTKLLWHWAKQYTILPGC